MPFFERSRSASSSSSSSRSISPLGASRYEQPYVPHTRTSPYRSFNGPENLHAANYDSSTPQRRISPQRTPAGPANLATPLQDLSSLGDWFEPKDPQPLSRHRPQRTSYLHGNGPKRPGLAPRTDMPLTVTNEELDFSRKPVKMDELDTLGSHARGTTPERSERKQETTSFSVGRSVMRNGPERAVRVVDADALQRLMPGYHGDAAGSREKK